MNFALRAAAAELAGHLAEGEIEKAFAALPAARPAPQSPPPLNAVPVAALQVRAKTYPSLQGFVRDIDRYMAAAVGAGARLVCFPELFGLFAAFASPLVRGAFRLGAGALGAGAGAGAGAPPYLPPLFAPFAFLPGRYLSIMARFARRYRVWVSAGSVFTWEGGRLYNRHTLLNATGKIAGVQDKLHLVPEEAAMGLSAGGRLSVVPTPFGKVALTVCMDATYFETFKIAKGLGADFALVPIANLEPYNHYLALRGAAMRVSETGLAAVKPALVSGGGFPLEFTGRAGVYYPLGFLRQSRETPQGNAPAALVERINVAALRRFTPGDFCLENEAFNQNYLAAITAPGANREGKP